MNRFDISENKKLDTAVLDEYYAKMSEGDVLVISRQGISFDLQDEGLLLRHAGFWEIVHKKDHPEKGYETVKCVKGKKEPLLLSVIVPVFNEENTAGELLKQLIDRQWTVPVEFVIVESNSADNTRDIAKEYEDRPNVTLVLEDAPSGKGNAVLNGIKHAKGNILAIQDGDLEYDVNDYDRLLQPFVEGRTHFVLGSRYNKDNWHMRQFKGGASVIADYLNIGQIVLTWVLNTACGCHLSDPFTMYKIFDRDCMYGINFDGGNFGLDWEIVIRFIRKGYVPVEMPVIYNARSYDEGKHIALCKTPIEGLRALWRSRFAAKVYDYGDDIDQSQVPS